MPGWPAFCSATTRKGTPCQFSARLDTGLCVNHDPTYAAQQQDNRKRGSQASKEARKRLPIRFDEFDLSNRSSVQGIVDATLRLVFAGEITEARAAQVIRLLSLAVRNFGTAQRQSVPQPNYYDLQRQAALKSLLHLLDK